MQGGDMSARGMVAGIQWHGYRFYNGKNFLCNLLRFFLRMFFALNAPVLRLFHGDGTPGFQWVAQAFGPCRWGALGMGRKRVMVIEIAPK